MSLIALLGYKIPQLYKCTKNSRAYKKETVGVQQLNNFGVIVEAKRLQDRVLYAIYYPKWSQSEQSHPIPVPLLNPTVPSCTLPVPLLYPSCILTVPFLYPCCTPAVPYPCCTPAVPLGYEHLRECAIITWRGRVWETRGGLGENHDKSEGC